MMRKDKITNLQKGTAKKIKKGKYYHFALLIEEEYSYHTR